MINQANQRCEEGWFVFETVANINLMKETLTDDQCLNTIVFTSFDLKNINKALTFLVITH